MSGPPTHHTTQSQSPMQVFDMDMFTEHTYPQHPQDLTPTEPLLNSEENGYLSSFYQNVQQGGAHLPHNMLSAQNVSNDEIGWLMSEPAPNVQQVLLTDPNSSARNHLVNQSQLSPHTPMSAYPHARQSIHHQSHSPFLQQQHLQQQHFSPPTSLEPQHNDRALSSTLDLAHTPSSSLRQQQQQQQHNQNIPQIPRLDTNPARLSLTTNPQNIYITPQSAPPVGRLNPRLYQFGSDQRFNHNGFIPAFEAERHEAREELLTQELKRLIPINRTPKASRHPSPDGTGQSSRKRRVDDADLTESPADSKRSRHNHSSDTASPVDTHPRPILRGRRGSLRGRGGSSSNTRRPQSPVAPESPDSANARKRENLNEEQKRQNHIASEQKRRNAIKTGFDTLTILVPGCQEQIPKSAVLVESANFLEKLVQCNKEARARIEAAGGAVPKLNGGGGGGVG